MNKVNDHTIAVFENGSVSLFGTHNVKSIDSLSRRYNLKQLGKLQGYHQSSETNPSKVLITHKLIDGRLVEIATKHGEVEPYVIKANSSSDSEVIKFLANAYRTKSGCGGHFKADMNGHRITNYLKILQSRSVSIPMDIETSGVFNGEGAF